MRGISYSRFGSAETVLEPVELATPQPAAGEVMVALAYSGVNPSDVKARAGTRPGVLKPAFPQIIPHSDGAGTIVAVGEGIAEERIGKRVWIWNGQWQRAFGTCASHIAVPAEQAVALPDAASFEDGAQLGIPGLTATAAVFGGGDIAGQTLLVQGGAGSVGYLALQLAKWGGARVITTARPEDHARLLDAGAEAVFDYRDPELAQKILADSGPIPRIVEVEFGLNVALDAEVIAENGTIAAYGSALNMSPEIPFGPLLFKATTIDILLIYILQPDIRARIIDRLHAALQDEALNLPVDRIHPLAEAHRAHEDVENGRRAGATLVDVTA